MVRKQFMGRKLSRVTKLTVVFPRFRSGRELSFYSKYEMRASYLDM